MKEVLLNKLKINFPLVQAGMVWVSGAKLAAACAKEGILGTIGAGSMPPDLLRAQIKKAHGQLNNLDERHRVAVNFPLIYSGIKEQLQVAIDEGVNVFITSAGSPNLFTKELKSKNKIVIHVTSSPQLAKKCELAGVDAVIAEGFEAGGHNGREELTTMVLIPQVVNALKIPIIAAGGIADGRGIVAALSLGASAVQMGTRFMMTVESSAHENYKKRLIAAESNETFLRLKKDVPVRLLNNKFAQEIAELEQRCATLEEIKAHLGKGRAKLGMHDGELDEGELEVGQIVGLIEDITSCKLLIQALKQQYHSTLNSLIG